MAEIKDLAKETAIYGLSSIVGKFLNWCLVPLYSYTLPNAADYGIITNLYAYTALLMIILTYGMETAFFRFMNDKTRSVEGDNKVYSTTLVSLFTTSFLFALGCILFASPLANFLGYEANPEFVALLGVVVALDAFTSIPFSYLRYLRKAVKFVMLKMVFIISNIVFNLFFLILCPILVEYYPSLSEYYDPSYGVGYIIFSNFLATVISSIILLPEVFIAKFNFDWSLLKSMLKYALPLLLFGVIGIMNQSIDKIIFPMLYPDKLEGMRLLGVYGACFKIAMIMMMFTYAFRFAYEPFIFAKYKDSDSKEKYADVMRYYVISTLIIFLGMVFYLDIFQYIIAPDYREGLQVVPIILASYLFQGVFYNLSLWYKLIDRTMFGTWFALVGFVILLVINIIFIPKYGYIACAWSSLVCFVVITLLSYVLGQKYYPINYPIKSILKYTLSAALLYVMSMLFKEYIDNIILSMLFNTVLLGVYVLIVVKNLLPNIFNKLCRRKN